MNDLNEQIESIGQSIRWMRTETPTNVIYAVVYWGNQDNKGGITKVIECKLDQEKHGWFNYNYGIEIYHNGKINLTKQQSPGCFNNLYISPNKNDCDIFTAAYLCSMNMTNKPVEPDKNILYGICVLLDGNIGWKPKSLTYLMFEKDEQGKYTCKKHPKLSVMGPGETQYTFDTNDENTQSVIKIFSSFKASDIDLVFHGICLTRYSEE